MEGRAGVGGAAGRLEVLQKSSLTALDSAPCGGSTSVSSGPWGRAAPTPACPGKPHGRQASTCRSRPPSFSFALTFNRRQQWARPRWGQMRKCQWECEVEPKLWPAESLITVMTKRGLEGPTVQRVPKNFIAIFCCFQPRPSQCWFTRQPLFPGRAAEEPVLSS